VTIAWIFLAAPRTGLLNRALEPVFGEGALDVFGLGGMIVVEALRLAPLALLLTAAALRVVDPALEASAVVSGVPRRVAVRRITLALVRPALLAAGLLLALRSIEAFEVPTLLGLPAGVWVFTSRIWLALDRPDGSLGPAAAGAVPLLVLTVVGTVALAASTRRRRSFETISPRGHRAERIALGRWRLPALAAVLAYLALAVALPLGALVWVSTQPFLAGVSDDALARANLDGYEELLRNETTRRSIVNSLTYGVSTATVAVALAALVAFVAVRTRIRGRLLLDTFAFLPIAVPGLVLGAGVLFLYVRLPIGVYGTAALLVIGLVTRYLPYGVRFAGAGMAQLGRELEEAARVSGVRGRRAFVGVTLPLVAPALLAAWATVFVLSLHDVSTSLLLYSPGTEVVSVRTWDLYEAGASQQVAALGVVTGAAGLALGAAAFALGAAAVRRSRARG
jgi:iron(III) transport system permease protein